MSIFPKETIQVAAQSIGITKLSDDVAAAIAPDAEYRMREIMQEAMKCMLHSRRTILTTEDVNSALQLRNLEPLYGFTNRGPLCFKQVHGHKELFYVDDADIDIKEVIDAPLPKVPLDVAVVAHWLAIEGVQPVIPQNVSAETSMEIRRTEGQNIKRPNEELVVDIKLPVKHVLSRELQLYFEKITELIISGAKSSLFKSVLVSLATDSGIHPLVPYFTQFITDEVTRSLDDVQLLFSLMQVVYSLLINPHIHIEPYLHQLMPSIITCLVAKRLGIKFVESHWDLRDYTASLVAFICKRFGKAYYNLQPRVTRTLLHAFLDPSKAMTQHYGAIQGLAALGSRVVRLLILPNLEPYLQILSGEMLFQSQMNEVKRYEAWRVYGALLNASGCCMYEILKSSHLLLPTRALLGDRGKGKIALHPPKSGALPRIGSVGQLTSPSRKRVIETDGFQGSTIKKPTHDVMGMNMQHSESVFESNAHASAESQARESESTQVNKVGQNSEEKMQQATEKLQRRSGQTLAEAWKEDAEVGPLLASLFELFGEALFPFVPQCEMNMFL